MANGRRSKEWGYELEKGFLRGLQNVFPELERRGSISYYADAPDLVQKQQVANWPEPIYIVATKDKGRGRAWLVTLSVEDLVNLVRDPFARGAEVRVQVKGRAQTWIGGLYEKLRKAR